MGRLDDPNGRNVAPIQVRFNGEFSATRIRRNVICPFEDAIVAA